MNIHPTEKDTNDVVTECETENSIKSKFIEEKNKKLLTYRVRITPRKQAIHNGEDQKTLEIRQKKSRKTQRNKIKINPPLDIHEREKKRTEDTNKSKQKISYSQHMS